MKIIFPKNIKKWIFSGMTINMWPISLNIIQLFIVAIWVAMAMMIFNTMTKSWSKVMWVLLWIPVLIIFIIIAFFKVSELWLVAFISKLIRNNFFDTTKKYQVNYIKIDPILVLIWKAKLNKESNWIFEQKENDINQEMLDRIENEWL